MNFKEKYRQDNEKIAPPAQSLDEIKQKLCQENRRGKRRLYIPMATCSLAAIFVLGLILSKNLPDTMEGIVSNESADQAPVEEKSDHFMMDDSQYSEASRVSTLVIDGRIYFESNSRLTIEESKKLMGEYLGLTESLYPYIQDDHTSAGYVDLHALKGMIGDADGMEVYTVNGYDSSFRLMTLEQIEGEQDFRVWESIDGLALISAGSLLKQMKIENNIKTITWDTFDNWNNSNPNPKEIELTENVEEMIEVFYEAMPYSLNDEALRNQFYTEDEVMSSTHKFVYLELVDGTDIQLRVSSEGYFTYAGMVGRGYLFKVEETVFQTFWNILD